jgi:hypothetical protein
MNKSSQSRQSLEQRIAYSSWNGRERIICDIRSLLPICEAGLAEDGLLSAFRLKPYNRERSRSCLQ